MRLSELDHMLGWVGVRGENLPFRRLSYRPFRGGTGAAKLPACALMDKDWHGFSCHHTYHKHRHHKCCSMCVEASSENVVVKNSHPISICLPASLVASACTTLMNIAVKYRRRRTLGWHSMGRSVNLIGRRYSWCPWHLIGS